MSDRVTGIAILDPTGWDNRPLLHMLCDPCDHAGAKPFHYYIPVLPKGDPEPNPPYCHWKYENRGDRIHVSPSVRIKSTDEKGNEIEVFHNEGAWDVAFQVHNPAEFQNASDQFRMVNGFQKII